MSLFGLLLRRAGVDTGKRQVAAMRELRPDPVGREGSRTPPADAWLPPVVDAPPHEVETEPLP
ncbi:MAG TPA: hypothetical protein PK743_03070 [Luteimonas sp.]|nr:hypothetical protein [Luteimonas sp.]HRO26983.1 hypothetical protein [Luteimonas sp.]HRP71603.1 hypothetical protein [Luteimonas sp.]